ncbi:putative multiple sugar ABC transporter solute-binding protein [Actinacidiphila reveromycinica]|uniref:Putative multiple sugar ABC transporter solute-binding protein n=1 Tax=Actinacidiphila reveromycinica TaxID=659352 RepID=A0A7U3UW12_9ACTN|nr:extracellular solute-binding protein [Streptomyces sp. SN-593]BBA99917.1 putative multiple sugar ABC transporter solute-binding protein [Streptomyces sp. SN-593]
MNQPTPGSISRRKLLGGAAFGLLALGTGGALSGCSSSDAASMNKLSDTLVPLPTYVPVTKGPKPDLPGNAIVQPVYYASPANSELFQSVTGSIGDGSTTSGFVVTYDAPPPANNTFLRYIEKQANAKFDLTFVPGDSFAEKFATMIAGNTLPEMVEFLTFAMPPRYPQILASRFQDLSEYLSGDKVKDYPNLANIPTPSWVSARINGKIYGVPEHRPPFGSILVCRPDIIKKLTGQEPAPKNEDDFTELCKAVTDAKANRYAITGQGGADGVDWAYDIIGAVFGVPNGWKRTGGKFVSKYETEEWVRAVSYIKKLYSAGYYHPDSPSMQSAQAKTYIANGTVLMHMDGISALLDTTLPKDAVTGAVVPFGADGGKGANYQGSSSFSFTALKKASPAKIKEQLRLLDYLAAPFGSKESFDLTHGEEGVHYTGSGANATLTKAGDTMVNASSLYRLAAGPQVLNLAIRMDEQLRRSHAWQVATQDMLVQNPVTGLYSATASQSASAESAVLDTMNDYILGRANLSKVRSAIKTWTSSVGNTIRGEYEKAYDKQHA